MLLVAGVACGCALITAPMVPFSNCANERGQIVAEGNEHLQENYNAKLADLRYIGKRAVGEAREWEKERGGGQGPEEGENISARRGQKDATPAKVSRMTHPFDGTLPRSHLEIGEGETQLQQRQPKLRPFGREEASRNVVDFCIAFGEIASWCSGVVSYGYLGINR